jgi:integrase
VTKARGTVIKRGDRYSVVLDLGRDENGKRIRKWHAGYADRDEAEKARTELLGSLDQQTYVAPSKITVRTFAEERWLPALDGLVAAGKLKASTVGSYRNLVDAYVLPRLGRVVLRELTADRLARFYGDLLKSGRRRVGKQENAPTGLSPTTVHAVHVTIHRMLKDAQRWGLLARNVADVASADAPRPVRREMTERVWSPDQLGAFLATVKDHRLSALWTLFATTGMRRGEAAGLTWSDVDLDRGCLTVRRSRVVVNHQVVDSTPKTASSNRMIGLDPATVRALRSHQVRQGAERLAWGPEYRRTDLVFTWEDGSPLHPDLVTRTFKRLAEKANLPPIVVHGLRHSYASAALEAGVDTKIVAGRLGHSSSAITSDLYQHVRREIDQNAADQVAALIFRGGGA